MSVGYCKPGLEATEHPTMLDIAWAAGVYEGEGTCSFNDTESVGVTQKNEEVLWHLENLFGGDIYSQGKYQQWCISGARARGFLMTIYSFLTERRKRQIRKALRKGVL